MMWAWAAAAPAVVGGLLLLTGRIHPAIAGYHLLCAAAVIHARNRVRPLFRWDGTVARWTAGVTLLVVVFLAAAPWVVNPGRFKEDFLRTVVPGDSPRLTFALFAAYTMLVHVPLEEVFWRGVATTPARLGVSLAGNALFFGLVHAVPLGLILGPVGLALSLPASAAGALWAAATIRSGSLWPALVAHAAADALLLAGMWFFFIP
jgi:membrane protease YdiL (CAAX protease family)